MTDVKINFRKASVLPASPAPNTLYFVESGTYAEAYLTNANGVAKKVGNSVMIMEVTTASADKNYVHDQAIPSTTWFVPHNLKKFPSVTCVDSVGREQEGDVQHLNNMNLIVVHNAAFSGKAYIN